MTKRTLKQHSRIRCASFWLSLQLLFFADKAQPIFHGEASMYDRPGTKNIFQGWPFEFNVADFLSKPFLLAKNMVVVYVCRSLNYALPLEGKNQILGSRRKILLAQVIRVVSQKSCEKIWRKPKRVKKWKAREIIWEIIRRKLYPTKTAINAMY